MLSPPFTRDSSPTSPWCTSAWWSLSSPSSWSEPKMLEESLDTVNGQKSVETAPMIYTDPEVCHFIGEQVEAIERICQPYFPIPTNWGCHKMWKDTIIFLTPPLEWFGLLSKSFWTQIIFGTIENVKLLLPFSIASTLMPFLFVIYKVLHILKEKAQGSFQ